MITIRQEKPTDYRAVYEVSKLAFKQEDEALLVRKIRQSPNYIPELSLVAIKDKKVVGHILFSIVNIKNDKGATQVLSLAPMATLPEYQNQGIGSLLVQRGLAECKKLGYKVVVVVGHPNYYPRFGFTPAKEKGLKLPFDAPDEAFLVYELMPGALDHISGTIEYPPAFNDVA